MLCTVTIGAQGPPLVPPLSLVQPEGQTSPPMVITLQDALARAKMNDAQFQTSAADALVAKEDRVQAKAAILPAFSFTTQYLGTQGDTPLKTGRFVSNDGVDMYRSWLVAHQEISPNMLTPYRRAQAAEALAQARLEIATRGLAVTVTQRYYGLITAERKYLGLAGGHSTSAAFSGLRAAAATARAGRAKRRRESRDSISTAAADLS